MSIDEPKTPGTPALEQIETPPKAEAIAEEVRDDAALALESHTAALLKQTPVVARVCETSEIGEERIFSREEVFKLIVSFAMANKLDVANLEVSKIINDEKGNLLMVEVKSLNPDGGYQVINYTIKGRHGRNQSRTTNLDRTSFDANDMPEGGGIVADYKEGKWFA